MLRIPALLFALCLAACGGGGGGGSASSSDSPPPATIAKFTVASSYTGVTYPVTVYLPASYAASTGTKPVVYAMDDEFQGPLIAQTLQSLGVDAIVVSVGNLGDARRFIDFDLPGATSYFKFLTLELIPRAEAEYRIDTTRRTLMGYSLSGLAAMIVLLEDGPSSRYFSGYVLTDPSLQFHTQDLYKMEQALWDTTHSLPLAVNHCATGGVRSPAAELQEQMQARGYQGLRYQFQLSTLSHSGVLAPCVNDGLRWIFKGGNP